MRSLLAIPVCLLASLSAEAADSRANRVAALRESFKYQPVEAKKAALPSETAADIVVLEKMTVTDSSQRTLEAEMAAKAAKEAKDRFAWNKGGLLLRSSRADVGAFVAVEDRVVGAVPTRELKVNVELLRIRW